MTHPTTFAPETAPTTSIPATQKEFTVKDFDKDSGTAFLKLDDGRHIAATIKDGVEGVKRHAKVAITSDGLDDEGAPKAAVITKVLS